MAHMDYNTPMETEISTEKMKLYKVNFPPSLWIAARRKAGLRSLAEIIRTLVTMWLEENIVLADDDIL